MNSQMEAEKRRRTIQLMARVFLDMETMLLSMEEFDGRRRRRTKRSERTTERTNERKDKLGLVPMKAWGG